jgi:hypothetical protein
MTATTVENKPMGKLGGHVAAGCWRVRSPPAASRSIEATAKPPSKSMTATTVENKPLDKSMIKVKIRLPKPIGKLGGLWDVAAGCWRVRSPPAASRFIEATAKSPSKSMTATTVENKPLDKSMIKVKIRIPNDRALTLAMLPSGTIGEIKGAIELCRGYRVSEQLLGNSSEDGRWHSEFYLEDWMSLSRYGSSEVYLKHLATHGHVFLQLTLTSKRHRATASSTDTKQELVLID